MTIRPKAEARNILKRGLSSHFSGAMISTEATDCVSMGREGKPISLPPGVSRKPSTYVESELLASKRSPFVQSIRPGKFDAVIERGQVLRT